MPAIAAEQLITGVAGQRHGDTLAGDRRYQWFGI